jgi:hypothetical protein
LFNQNNNCNLMSPFYDTSDVTYQRSGSGMVTRQHHRDEEECRNRQGKIDRRGYSGSNMACDHGRSPDTLLRESKLRQLANESLRLVGALTRRIIKIGLSSSRLIGTPADS